MIPHLSWTNSAMLLYLMYTLYNKQYLHHVSVGEDVLSLGEPPDGLQPLVGFHQEVHAVHAYYAQHHEAHRAHRQPGVLHGVGHGQDSGADVAFQQVEDCITVAEKVELEISL